MKSKIVLSAVLSSLLFSPLSAINMLERFELMEKEMEALKAEIAILKSNKKEIDVLVKEDDSDEKEEDEDAEESKDSDEAESSKEDEDSDKDENSKEDDKDEDDDEEELSVEEQLEEIHENLTELNKATSGSHLKFGVDYRFAADNLQYEMANGDKAKNDSFLTNRLWINMDWAATDTMSFHGQLAYNNAFGQRGGASTGNEFEQFAWITNENAYDDVLRVRSAYFFYSSDAFLGTDIPWTFSIGRRSSTVGAPANLREDDSIPSPLAHTMNVEFDGLSIKYMLGELVPGMKLQFCAGRGLSNAQPKFSNTPYAEDVGSASGIDLAGIVFTAYDDGHYLAKTQYYYASNLIDRVSLNSPVMQTVGNMHSATALFMVNGLGKSDYLDESRFFISGAVTQTDPNDKGMLGSTDSEMGYSYWTGLQVPSLISDDGRMGLEYNHGSQYWRSITYAEDTNIGSKVAARGDAYEVYFTEYLVEDIFSLQLRYTYIDYEYAGSNGFFGSTSGDAHKISATDVDKAQDIRLYLRYKY